MTSLAMITRPLLLLLSVLVVVASITRAEESAATEEATPALHGGFNPKINWLTFDGAKEAASSSHRPILLAIWLPGDRRTENFRSLFTDERVERLSTMLHMVQAPWGADSSVAKQWDLMPFIYGPQMDGTYVPRIVFLSARGQAQLITNRDLLSHRWYYTHPDSLVRSMEEAIDVLINQAPLNPPPGWNEKQADDASSAETFEQRQEEAAAAKEKKKPSAPTPPTPAPEQALPSMKPRSRLERKLQLLREQEEREAKAREAEALKASKKDEL